MSERSHIVTKRRRRGRVGNFLFHIPDKTQVIVWEFFSVRNYRSINPKQPILLHLSHGAYRFFFDLLNKNTITLLYISSSYIRNSIIKLSAG